MLKIKRITRNDYFSPFFNRFIESFPSLQLVAFSDICAAGSADEATSASALERINAALDAESCNQWRGKVAVHRYPASRQRIRANGWTTKVVLTPWSGGRFISVRFDSDGIVHSAVADFSARPSRSAAEPLLHGYGSACQEIQYVQTCEDEAERPRFIAAAAARLRRMVHNGVIAPEAAVVAFKYATQNLWLTIDEIANHAAMVDDRDEVSA